MPDQANITSIEALESFRNGLVEYREKACAALDEAAARAQRFKDWLKHDRKVHWQNEVRARGQVFENARQAWFAAQMADHRISGTHEVAYKRARRALREAEARLSAVKRWSVVCDGRIDPLSRQMEAMYNLLGGEVARSIAHLTQIVNTLSDYAGLAKRPASGPPPPPADGEPGEVAPPGGSAP